MYSPTTAMTKIFEYETILNELSEKRYHVKQNEELKCYLVEVKKYGQEEIIVEGLTLEEMYGVLRKHIKVEFVSDSLLKKRDHVKELWDKLDPRDRDIILRHCSIKVDTLSDWRILDTEIQRALIRWFYSD